ncbi:nucleotidyltransferase domain-containing protein [Sedimentibacter sp.]|uniref:nucleotidyltransferase domain-containing protein n=1 Tax=Sedimentibacter sp. TaxID=1960295 RepID=UPI00289FE98D|nr:nucleotidyltransferase domain-containing protein [Sedimentibacter sp.]
MDNKLNRPFVNISRSNIVEELINVLNQNMDKILSLDGIVGVILDGGLSRGYADYLSEIDIIIYLDQEHFIKYNKSKNPIPIGISKINGYLYDIKIENFDELFNKDYDMVALWDLSYAKIIYDPVNKISEFIKYKLSLPIDISQAAGLMFDAWWNYRLAGDIWINRQDVAQGHYVLNNAVKPLISALFIANEEYIPHDKWIIHMSRTLEWKPDNFDNVLVKILSSGNFDLASIISRQNAIDELWTSIDKKLTSKVNLKISFMQKYYYETFKILIEKGKIPIEEWEKICNINILNNQPFSDVTYISNETIHVDFNKLLSLKPDDMYQWFYEVADAVRTQLNIKSVK